MIDPFKITEPTCINFSGGRTSAYMLWRVLQSNGGLPDEAKVVYCNTGKEEEETLKFINDCSVNWGVHINWLEYIPVGGPDGKQWFKEVSYETASRNGEPFEEVIKYYGMLPNPRNKSCTSSLKIRTCSRYLKSLGWTEWNSFVGIRFDEQRRVRKLRPDYKGENPTCPLSDAKIGITEIDQFWSKQDFKLDLPTFKGKTLAGNCDLCYLKPASQILSLIQEKPSRAIWWANQEKYVSQLPAAKEFNGAMSLFRIDRPSYASMSVYSNEQVDMFDPNEEAISCFCGD